MKSFPTQMLLFLATFVASGFAGIGALLRSNSNITYRTGVSSFLNSGLLGLVIYMFWVEKYGTDSYAWGLMAVSVLAGLGGYKAIDFILEVAKAMVLKLASKNDSKSQEQ